MIDAVQQEAVDDLVAVLDLEPIEVDLPSDVPDPESLPDVAAGR